MERMAVGANSFRKLVLHLDVNNTVFIGDSITKSVTPEETLNEYLTDVVWGQVDESGEWIGDINALHVKPPEKNSVSYYKFAKAKYREKPRSEFKAHIRSFTEEEIGKPFRRFYDQMIEALEFPGDIKSGNNSDLPFVTDKKAVPHHCIVPSFYKLLDHLCESQKELAIIFRTFGGDGHVVLQATKDFLQGKHVTVSSEYPHKSSAGGCPVEDPRYKVNFTPGKITRSSNQTIMKCPEDHLVLSNLQDIYKYFRQTKGIKLIGDDYDWWKTQHFNSLAAKPLLINPSDDSVQHIMFDDNFRPWEPEDSIVNLLLAKEGSFCSADPATFDDVCVVKADFYQSICNRNYFIDKIQLCERNYSKFVCERENR